ncbi:hypothetical protein EUGRSUZ_D02427 [Eucalyptus grandis]|uniref:Uncharacterized protein n=2 Tax=Eucalyptus grandis TaxID=71139 RepID=A0ACC3L899_EUCGR|nr:hypothetical protein EUGRSUZ_D02427 [Eucalyptus grandis]
MNETIERYHRHTKDTRTGNKSVEENMQHLKDEAANMMKKIELLEDSRRKLLGEGLGSCSIEELQQIEQQLERSVISIRARKTQVFKEQIDKLKEKEKMLTAENAILTEKVTLLFPPVGYASVESSPHKEQMSAGIVHFSERAARVRRWRPVSSSDHQRPDRGACRFRIKNIALASQSFKMSQGRRAFSLLSIPPSHHFLKKFQLPLKRYPSASNKLEQYQYDHVSILFHQPVMKG